MFSLSDQGLGVLQMLLSLVGNFGQPIFGYLIDRKRWGNVIGVGLLAGVLFSCMVGFMPTLPLFTLALLLSGLGTALFHPQGGSSAAIASGRHRAVGMSIFGMGGSVGFALGALISPLLHGVGMAMGLGPLQGFIFAVPLALALTWRLHVYNRANVVAPSNSSFSFRKHLLPYWRPMAPILFVMVIRSMTVVAYQSFFQVVLGDRGLSVYHQGGSVFWFVFGGAVGGMVGAYASDRLGRRCVTVVSLLLSPPLLYYSLYTPFWPAMILLFASGFILRAAEPVNIAQTQDLVPQGMSMASSIGMGFAWGLAGIVTPIVGWISDSSGSLVYALSLTAFLPVAGALVGLVLPTRSAQSEVSVHSA